MGSRHHLSTTIGKANLLLYTVVFIAAALICALLEPGGPF